MQSKWDAKRKLERERRNAIFDLLMTSTLPQLAMYGQITFVCNEKYLKCK